MNPTRKAIALAYRLGRESVSDRDPVIPYSEVNEEELFAAFCEGRLEADVEMGEAFADFCDPSSRDCYE